jgi:G6PDH family F420-dependent oxidoreductase
MADGMIGVAPDPRMVEAFEAAGGRGKPRVGQVHVCWAESEEKARRIAVEKWPNNALTGQALTDLSRPKDFERTLAPIPADTLIDGIVCGPDPDEHIEALGRYAAAGFTEVYVHQIGPDQEGFVDFYSEQVLSRLA